MSSLKWEKTTWIESGEKPGPKKTTKDKGSFHENKKEELTASDKGSWFDQPPKSVESIVLQQKLTLVSAGFVSDRRLIDFSC
jgi:hypothetical protein